MEIDGYEIRPLNADTFHLFEDLNNRIGGMFARCWCVNFHAAPAWFDALPETDDKQERAARNHKLKKELVEGGEAHAALVCEGDEAVAWAQYGTPAELTDIHHRKQYDAEADLIPDYRITCIKVDKQHRGQGITATAIRGALALIAEAGGGIVEGYPHVIDPEAKKVNPSWLYNTTRSTYERVGFEFIRDKGLKNCVMRVTVVAS